jgi:hypothetical protein
MRNFIKIVDGINVEPICFSLLQHPELWDERIKRKDDEKSPHRSMSDIWVRYNDDTYAKDSGDYSKFNDLHYPIWYPAINHLPMIRPLCIGLMGKMGATHLGGVLITKIPPGGSIEPHIDSNWHAKFYNCKLYIPLQTNNKCYNRCEDEIVVMETGQCWYFNNTVDHEIRNNGYDDRITLIICMRVE